MDGHGNSMEPKRLKLPRLLEPIDTINLRKNRSIESIKKRGSISSDSTLQLGLSGKEQHCNKPAIPHCCSMIRCRCEAGDIDDCLSDIEKQMQLMSNIEDPYQWTEVKEIPKGITTEKNNRNFLGYGENDENAVKSKGIDLSIVGISIAKKSVRDLERLEASGCIANIKVARAGLSFEVFNESVHQNIPDKSCAFPALKCYKDVLGNRRSKKHTAEDIENKLKKAEMRRKARLAEKLDKNKVMIGKYHQRVLQMEHIVRERHENVIKKIERQVSKTMDKKDWTATFRGANRGRTRTFRIANLMEKRHNLLNKRLKRIEEADIITEQEENGSNDSNNQAEEIKETNDAPASPPQVPRSLTDKQNAEHFEPPHSAPSPLQVLKNISPSGAGDCQDSSYDGDV